MSQTKQRRFNVSGSRLSRARHSRHLHLERLELRRLLAAAVDPFDPYVLKLGMDLAVLDSEYRTHEVASRESGGLISAFRPRNSELRLYGDRVAVEFYAKTDAGRLSSELQEVGIAVTGSYGRGVTGLVGLDQLPRLAGLESLAFAKPVYVGLSAGAVTSQGDTSMSSSPVRDLLGIDGTGINVGLLSDSYANLPGAGRSVATGDLPGASNPFGRLTPVNVLQDLPAGVGNEVQQVSATGMPTGGSFTLQFNDGGTIATTAAIPSNASAAQLQTALEGLPNVAVGDVAVAGGPLPGAPLTVTFQGALANANFRGMIADDSAVVGGGIRVSTTTDGNSGVDEGRAMLEIVHDVAPGSSLLFATAFLGQPSFAANIIALQAAGSRVIVDDVFYFEEPFFQDGVIAQAVDTVVASGSSYFALANNHGRNSYESPFQFGINVAPGAFPSTTGPAFLGGRAHDFDPGPVADILQRFTLQDQQQIRITLQWDQPFFSVSGGAGSTNNVDIYVIDALNNVVAGSTRANIGQDPSEFFAFTNNTGAAANYDLLILHNGPAANDPGFLKYINITNGGDGMGNLEFDTRSGTAYGHANSATGNSVGAANYEDTPPFGVAPPVVTGFSSAGGIGIRFDTAGNPIGPVFRQTPNITAPQGANTTFFGGDSDGDGFPNFFGTSAAAPHAGAVAALMLQAASGASPAQIKSVLQQTAIDMDDPETAGFDNGFDNGTGYGLVQAYAAVVAIAGSDALEPNNSIAAATVLGSDTAITLRDLSITPGDVDFFRITAHHTGKLAVNLFFDHDLGNLNLRIRDASGDIVALATSTDDDERLVIPVVTQEAYFVEIFGAAGNVANTYALEIENFAVTVPILTDLNRGSDSGESWSDNITRDNTPTIDVLVDLVTFLFDVTDGNTLLTAAQANAGTTPGFAVQLAITDVATGNTTLQFSEPLGAFSPLWRFTPAIGSPLADGTYHLSAAAYVVDGKNPNAEGNGAFNAPLILTVDTTAPVPGAIDLATESDSGFSSTDNVTSIQTPTFTGVAEAGALLRLFAGTRLVGMTVVGSDESDGVLGDGLGRWSTSTQSLADGVYSMTSTLEDLAGNVSAPSAALQVQIDSVEPNTPYLDIPPSFDTGRSDEDNVTRISTLLLSATTHDAGPVPPQLFPNNLIYRIYVRPEVGNEFLLFDSSVAVGGLTGLTQIFTTANLLPGATTLGALPNGAHNFKLEVEDRAGNISHDFLLPFVIDSVAPPIPTLRLDPAVTDTGLVFDPSTGVDEITRVSTPGFYGTAEANSIVRLAADTVANNAITAADISLGLTQAIPLDGNDAFPGGQYRLTSVRDLNNPDDVFPRDGLRQIGATAEDLAGNISPAVFLNIAIDTTPPQVTAVNYTTTQSVFAPKPQAGPTPRVDAIQVTFRDFRPAGLPPVFDVAGVDLTLALDPGNYAVRGDHTGRVLITSVTLISSAAGVVTVQLNFDEPLPDDRYTLEISEDISDPAGNLLDGDSRASEPGLAAQLLPSGNQIPGGDFSGRFTVDSRPEIAVYSQASVYVDINGNFVFDPEGDDNDATNRDFVYQFGLISDGLFAGNFSAVGGAASGFDKLGAYGFFAGSYSFVIDTNDDGVGDVASIMPAAYQVNGIPVAGNFSAAKAGDEIGLFDGQAWYVDLNGNNAIEFGERIPTNYNGIPVVGDFNGDGNDDFAVYNNSTNSFIFDTNRDGLSDFVLDVRGDLNRYLGVSGFTDKPVAGDLNLDGIDDLGLWFKGRDAVYPAGAGEWLFWVSDVPVNPPPNNNPADFFREFSPAPLGNDLYARFGNQTALPLLGNFDPPVASSNSGPTRPSLTNRVNAHDVNSDGRVSPADALAIINGLNRGLQIDSIDSPIRALAMTRGLLMDTNGDGKVSPLDALQILNRLNRAGLSRGDGEQSLDARSGYAAAVDLALRDLDNPLELEEDELELVLNENRVQ